MLEHPTDPGLGIVKLMGHALKVQNSTSLTGGWSGCQIFYIHPPKGDMEHGFWVILNIVKRPKRLVPELNVIRVGFRD